jgi:hypothetical protein
MQVAYGSFRECQAIVELEKVNDTTLNKLQDQLGAVLYTLSRKTADRTETVSAANAVAAAD